MAEVIRYGAGHGASGTVPGDFILTHRYRNVYSSLIATGQRTRFRKERAVYSHWSHAAFVTGYNGEIIEARGHGIIRQNLHEYKDREYHYVHPDHPNYKMEDRLEAVTFAESCLGEGYGFLTIAALSVAILTGWKLYIGIDGTEICSALVARALERGPFVFPKGSMIMMPADLAEFFDIRP